MIRTLTTINNKRHISGILLLFILVILSACKPEEKKSEATTYKFERYTLGTYVQLQVYANKTQANKFISQFDVLSKQDTKDLYAWNTNGWLSFQNSYLVKAQCGLPVDGKTLALFKKIKILHKQSNGLFDPTVMPLVELWGFHNSEEMRASPPTDKEIKDLRNKYGKMQNLDVRDKTICATQPLKVDLGGIAKGWFAEKTLNLLNANNIKNTLIGFGGDLIALGEKEDGSAWKVGLKNPDIHWEGFNAPALFKIEKNSNKITAIFTSGDYERQFEHQGKRLHHILDPRTGYPNTEVRSVTVMHSDPVLADAAATALHVAGKDWQRIAHQMNVSKVLVLFPNKQAQITESLSKLTTWLDEDYSVEIITPSSSTN